jgi:hypothetical protein
VKLPVSFSEFSKDPSKAVTYLMIFAVIFLYIRMEKQDNQVNTGCEGRLTKCEQKLEQFSSMLKTQDSISSALRAELTTYQKLGIIK